MDSGWRFSRRPVWIGFGLIGLMRLTPQQVVGDVLERYKAHLALRPASTGSDAAFHFVPPRPQAPKVSG